jgi:hypothetical protein
MSDWKSPRESFPALLTRLFEARYTGALVLHFRAGTPTVAEQPSKPRRTVLSESLDKADEPMQT